MSKEHRERAERLRAYVEETNGVPAPWFGCSSWPAQWVADETGIEFDLDWPAYADEDEGRALIEAEGGLVEIWKRVARQAGLSQVVGDYPVLGDVGVIVTDNHGQVGGIFADGGAFCIRAEKGVRMLGPRAYHIEPGPEGPVFRPIMLGCWRV